MNYIVPIICYISPLILGLVVAFLVVTSIFTQQGIWGLGKVILYYVTLPIVAIMIIIGLIPCLPAGTASSLPLDFANLIWLFVFLWGWLVMVTGITYLFITLSINKNVVYIIVSFIILLTNATVFYINPFISAWQDNPALRQWVIKIGVVINPMLTIASNFFRHDLLRSREMYSICDMGPYYFYSYADWFILWIIYMIIGVLTIALAVIKNYPKGSRRDN